ncbi:hypothetical protein L1887_57950 [Cichorium endivia]|nr:hypothetical protein L1887_57950 [Cichorium endivia]
MAHRTESAILLYNLAGQHDTVVAVLNKELGSRLMEPSSASEWKSEGLSSGASFLCGEQCGDAGDGDSVDVRGAVRLCGQEPGHVPAVAGAQKGGGTAERGAISGGAADDRGAADPAAGWRVAQGRGGDHAQGGGVQGGGREHCAQLFRDCAHDHDHAVQAAPGAQGEHPPQRHERHGRVPCAGARTHDVGGHAALPHEQRDVQPADATRCVCKLNVVRAPSRMPNRPMLTAVFSFLPHRSTDAAAPRSP